jgi:ribosomal-protein-alanine N-acetyltransferase
MEIHFIVENTDYQVRSFKLSDKNSLVKYANNYNIARNLRDLFPHPYTEADASEWLKLVCSQKPELNFAIANNKELIGGIGLEPQKDINRFSVEIGYWLAESFWGMGIMVEAVKILTGFVFNGKTGINFNRIFAGVFESNTASEKVLIKAGYKKEGVLRKCVFKEDKFLDQYIYSILKDEWEH